jgi:DNA (cytosine-5)-methyltransferase 1
MKIERPQSELPMGGGSGEANLIAFDSKASGRNGFGVGEISPTLRAMNHTAGNQNSGGQVAIAIQDRAVCENPDAGPDGVGVRDDGLLYTVGARTVPQAVAFQSSQSGCREQDTHATLDANNGSRRQNGVIVPNPVAFESRFARNGRGAPSEIVPPIKAQSVQTGRGDAAPLTTNGHAVRRLTVVEVARLQGFPDTYCHIDSNSRRKIDSDEAEYLMGHGLKCWQEDEQWYTRIAADGPMYRAFGNSMAVPVLKWLGLRIKRATEDSNGNA